MARRVALHLALLGMGLAGFRLAVVPAEVCPVATAAQVSHAADEAAAWMLRNLGDDGRYLYGYYRDTDEVSPQYNGTRHAGVTMSLYQYAAVAGHPEVMRRPTGAWASCSTTWWTGPAGGPGSRRARKSSWGPTPCSPRLW